MKRVHLLSSTADMGFTVQQVRAGYPGSEVWVREAELERMRYSRQAMHRRAQRAEGKSLRSIALLDLILARIKDVIPILPKLPSPYPLSLHTLYHHLHAVRRHAKNSSGAAASVQHSYYYEFWQRDRKRAEKAEAELDRLRLQLDQKDALYDSAYQAGVKLGWNLGVSGDEAGFQSATSSTEHVVELKRIRAALAALDGEDGE